jgi:hypothetical protein
MPDRQIKGQPYVAKTHENSWPATICVHLWQSGQSVVPSWASVNYAKQTQFSKRQNYRNTLSHTDLQQYSAPLHPQKTNPNKANPPTQYAIRNTQYENQTQTNPMSK